MVIFQLSKCVLFQNICHGSLLYRVHIFKFSIFRCFFRLVALCHNFCELFLLALPLDCSLVSILRHILFYLYNEWVMDFVCVSIFICSMSCVEFDEHSLYSHLETWADKKQLVDFACYMWIWWWFWKLRMQSTDFAGTSRSVQDADVVALSKVGY